MVYCYTCLEREYRQAVDGMWVGGWMGGRMMVYRG